MNRNLINLPLTVAFVGLELVLYPCQGSTVPPRPQAKMTTASRSVTMDKEDKSLPIWKKGAIIRGPRDRRLIALEFTGGYYAEGGTTILNELKKRHIKASFFFIGDFYRNPDFKSLIERIRDEGHYLGPHSDKHPLYASWEDPPKLLITREEFDRDLTQNLLEIERFGIPREKARLFIPPYEHYTEEIAAWTRERGMLLINFSPGTRSNADYMEDNDKNFVSSPEMVRSILTKEETDPDGLNGFLLLMHVGAGPKRTRDHLYNYLGDLLDELLRRGYQFVRVDEMLADYVPKGEVK
ncbi:MAG: polysaccharide deacetylase family protein [Candidatus Sumerlaeaceae bacterium]|nr:polysaccharide deacetylase family protein [Candidatus Sumerlaeaceae bacterium]